MPVGCRGVSRPGRCLSWSASLARRSLCQATSAPRSPRPSTDRVGIVLCVKPRKSACLLTVVAVREVGAPLRRRFGPGSVKTTGSPFRSCASRCVRSAPASRVRYGLGLAGQFGRPAENSFPALGFLVPPEALRCVENPRVAGSIPSLATISKLMNGCPPWGGAGGAPRGTPGATAGRARAGRHSRPSLIQQLNDH